MVYLTSGTLDGRPSERRNRESATVLSKIGLAPEQIHFLGTEFSFPDGRLYQQIESASAAVRNLYRDRTKPTRIFTPAWEGGHQDHDATHIVACYLAKYYACIESSRQFPIYHGNGLPGIMWHTFSPLPANGKPEIIPIRFSQLLRYLRYCLHYHSQWTTWLGLYPMYALNLMIRGKQYLQPLHLKRLQTAPHPGRCLYERRKFCKRDQFVRSTRGLVEAINSSEN